MGLALVALSRRRVLGSATTMRLPYEHFSKSAYSRARALADRLTSRLQGGVLKC